MKKSVFRILIIICAVVFVSSGLYIGNYVLKSKKSKDKFASLSEFVELTSEVSSGENSPSEKPSQAENAERLEKYEKLHAQNEDFVGWLKIPGTEIDYPVMQTKEEPEFYLRRDFYGESSGQGTPFVDYRCDVFEPTTNTIIYGHNMSDKTMFAPLLSYEDPVFYKDHKTVSFDTLEKVMEYEIYAVVVTDTDIWSSSPDYYGFINAENAKEFNRFVDIARENSIYETGVEPRYGDRLLALSTCEKVSGEGRLIVMARYTEEKAKK